MANNQDMFSSKGATKGCLKSNYAKVENAVNAIKNQPFLMDIINNSEKQVIMVGKIAGVPMKAMFDLINLETGDIFDLKCMSDFKTMYDENRGQYVDWWEGYNYHVQMYIYREIARQNGVPEGRTGLIAANKKETPDIKAIQFSDGWLELAKWITLKALERYKEVKAGDEPISCEHCEWCIKNKVVNEFEII